MELLIFTKEKGLHNPYSFENYPHQYNLASFSIDCVKEAEKLFSVSVEHIFSRSAKARVATTRGTLMIYLYRSLANVSRGITTGLVANMFGREHSTLLHYKRLHIGGNFYFKDFHDKLSLQCDKILEEHPLRKGRKLIVIKT